MEGARVETELATMPGKDEIRAMLPRVACPDASLVRQLSAPGQDLSYARRCAQLKIRG
jgi:hypothetical protein